MRLYIMIAALLGILIGCSNGKDNSAKASPDLSIALREGSCLDLQSAVSQMAQAGFSYPGFVYTRNFEKIGPEAASSEFVNNLYAASFRAESIQFDGIDELRGLKQQGCESVTLPIFAGVVAKYKIFNYGPGRLEMHLEQSELNDALNTLPDDQRIQIVNFPMIKEYSIQIPNSRTFDIRTEYTTVPNACQKTGSILVAEELVYRWASSDPQAPALIHRDYWNRLHEIAGEPLIDDGLTGDVSVDLSSAAGLAQNLKSKINERCL
jgi:hypothetical protein